MSLGTFKLGAYHEVSTTVKLMDARLLLITDRLNNISDRQERVETSVKLLHDSGSLKCLHLKLRHPHRLRLSQCHHKQILKNPQ